MSDPFIDMSRHRLMDPDAQRWLMEQEPEQEPAPEISPEEAKRRRETVEAWQKAYQDRGNPYYPAVRLWRVLQELQDEAGGKIVDLDPPVFAHMGAVCRSQSDGSYKRLWTICLDGLPDSCRDADNMAAEDILVRVTQAYPHMSRLALRPEQAYPGSDATAAYLRQRSQERRK